MAKPDKRRLRGVVFLSGPQPYMWYAEVLKKIYNEAGKRACETPNRTFYDAINNEICRLGIKEPFSDSRKPPGIYGTIIK